MQSCSIKVSYSQLVHRENEMKYPSNNTCNYNYVIQGQLVVNLQEILIELIPAQLGMLCFKLVLCIDTCVLRV